MNDVYLLLGSNIEREYHLPQAIELLRGMVELVAVSSVYETAPVGFTTQPSFFNAAAYIRTPLSPSRIKHEIITPIEQQLKRVRQRNKNAPRTIDIDIILFNQEVRLGGRSPLPDPDLLRFGHVAVPIAELAPALPHPQTGEPLATIAARLQPETAIQRRPEIRL